MILRIQIKYFLKLSLFKILYGQVKKILNPSALMKIMGEMVSKTWNSSWIRLTKFKNYRKTTIKKFIWISFLSGKTHSRSQYNKRKRLLQSWDQFIKRNVHQCKTSWNSSTKNIFQSWILCKKIVKIWFGHLLICWTIAWQEILMMLSQSNWWES